MKTLYQEMQQIPVVRKHRLTDGEIEHFIQKAGEFEYQYGMSREEANRAALELVLEERNG